MSNGILARGQKLVNRGLEHVVAAKLDRADLRIASRLGSRPVVSRSRLTAMRGKRGSPF